MPEEVHPKKERSEPESTTTENVREAIATSEHGAPAVGEAVQDIFTADEIFERVVATAEEEFSTTARLLFLSGLAAGLAISLSFLGVAALEGGIPGSGNYLLHSLLYPLGFLFVAIGRYQLFTENTLTPVTMVLTRLASLPRLLRIWGIVLVANLLGTALAALYFAEAALYSGPVQQAALEIGHAMVEQEWGVIFHKGVLAGFLIAGMVWLNHAARSTTARVLIIFVLMYTVSAAELAHCIVGSTEVLYVVFSGEATFAAYLWSFEIPAALGNTLGGVLLVAILNFARTREKVFPELEALTWREWLWGERT